MSSGRITLPPTISTAMLQSINDHWLCSYDEDEIFEFLMKHVRLSVNDAIFIRLHIRQMEFALEVSCYE